jgi:hypothetical protein
MNAKMRPMPHSFNLKMISTESEPKLYIPQNQQIRIH